MSGEVEGGGRRRRRSRSGRHHHKRRREREVSCWCWGKWVIRSGHENDKMTSRQICDGSKSQRSGLKFLPLIRSRAEVSERRPPFEEYWSSPPQGWHGSAGGMLPPGYPPRPGVKIPLCNF
eukprot:s5_g37.t2